MVGIAWVNGKLLPPSEAAISPIDRGFLYGEGLFETMRTYDGRVFRLSQHLDRLIDAAAEIGFTPPGRAALSAAVAEALAAGQLRDAAVRHNLPVLGVAQVNRGASKSAEPLSCNDLRDSGALENDSAAALRVNRIRKPDVEYQAADPVRYIDLTIDKNRYWARTTADDPLTLCWWPVTGRIEDLTTGTAP